MRSEEGKKEEDKRTDIIIPKSQWRERERGDRKNGYKWKDNKGEARKAATPMVLKFKT